MSNERDPTSKKCKHGVEDVVSVVLAIGISVLSTGLLFSIFKPGDSGGGFVKLEGSGSVTVGGLLDKEEDKTDDTTSDTDNTTPDTDNNGADTDTDTGEGTDTENNDNTADTDTTPGEDFEYFDYVKTYDQNGELVLGAYPAIPTDSLTIGTVVENDNTFLQVRNVGCSDYSGASGVTKIDFFNKTNSGDCYIFETSVKIKGVSKPSANFGRIRITDVRGDNVMNVIIGVDENEKFKASVSGVPTDKISVGTVLFDSNDESISVGMWFNLRFELYYLGAETATSDNTYLKMYVNDKIAYDGLASWALNAEIANVQIDHISSSSTYNICYDDFSFKRIEKLYVAETT